MRILFNQTIPIINNYQRNNQKNITNKGCEKTYFGTILPNISNANFSNITFCRNQDAEFLLKQYKHLKCAYSGKLMLGRDEIKEIFQKLEKRPNAQAAINLLQSYERYMHETEAMVFDLFKNAQYKNKRDFQDILIELQPEALIRLKEKQIAILTSTDKIITKMSPAVAELVKLIRDNALAKIEDNTFGRQPPLEMIKSVKAKGNDLKRIRKIYQTWYKLPNSARDVDAFIVKYARRSHDEISKRLISSSRATIEHVIPISRKKNDTLHNMILVSARFNNERHSMPLDEYIMLNDEIEIEKNLQKYIDSVIHEVGRKKSEFNDKGWYPNDIRTAINTETSGKVDLDITSLYLTKAQKKEANAPEKLIKKYSTKIS